MLPPQRVVRDGALCCRRGHDRRGTVWYVTQCLSPHDLLMVARATGSFRACVGYILFCLTALGLTREGGDSLGT